MGLFGKKKNDFAKMDELDGGLDNSLDSGLNLEPLNSPDQGQESNFDSFGNPRPQKNFSSPDFNSPPGVNEQRNGSSQTQEVGSSKDMELVLAKLDAIKSEVQTINHKLELLERKSTTGEKKYIW